MALEILTLLLENPTDDSVEVAVGFIKEIGLKLGLRILAITYRIQGCWGNPDGGNPDGRGNPDGLLGKNHKTNFSKKLYFSRNLTSETIC